MNIKVYGTGCPKCQALMDNVEAALKSTGCRATVEKVTDIDRIVERGIITTPALEIDGRIVSSGRLLREREIAAHLMPDAPEGSCGCSCGSDCAKPKRSKFRRFFGTALLVFALAALAWSVTKDEPKASGCCAGASVVTESPLTVYYFHGARRCMTCNKIEQLTKAAVESAFKEEVEKGKILFVSVDLDLPENEHYVRDFELTTRTVVIQDGTRYERLDKVWELVRGDEGDFRRYIEEGVRRMRGGGK